ncbi:MAG: protein phosphatase 2C domain-containing protein, partial [Deltaproteobacteria bacterium]|nr:protein phosphatase 2C domain-containing protein [Deltaproteobacteria bacterium]
MGKVREHNEDAHFFDADLGLFIVCDGMGGHAAGEVASAIAIRTIRQKWSSDMVQQVADGWLDQKTPEAKKQLFAVVRGGVIAAHDAILGEAARDEAKAGMGTTLVGAMIVGNDMVFAHAGDSRAYLVRDQIAMQLTEDHTLLARLLAAGIDVDVSGEGSRFRSMLTNALGIGKEVKVSTFVVPLADGDRFLLCSDGISEYVKEEEVGEVLSKQPSPARAAQKLIELALDRGGGDNATAVVVRVLEAGETPQSAEMRNRDERVIASCGLWGTRTTPQQRLRALRLANARDYGPNELLPANTLGDRVAWIIVEGEVVQNRGADELGPGALVYPEALVADAPLPHREDLAVTRTDVRALALRADDFRELCDDDAELGEALLEALQPLIAARRARPPAPERYSTDMEIAEAAARRLTEEREVATPPNPSLDDVLSPGRSRDPRVVELDQILGHAPIQPPPVRPRVMQAAVAPPDGGEDDEGDDDGGGVYIVSAVPRDEGLGIRVETHPDGDTQPRVARAPRRAPASRAPSPELDVELGLAGAVPQAIQRGHATTPPS